MAIPTVGESMNNPYFNKKLICLIKCRGVFLFD